MCELVALRARSRLQVRRDRVDIGGQSSNPIHKHSTMVSRIPLAMSLSYLLRLPSTANASYCAWYTLRILPPAVSISDTSG